MAIRKRIVVDVDRDSVAMGDDMESHKHQLTFPNGTRLAEILDSSHPEIRARGWYWVAVVDGAVSAVWSVDHGVRLLARNRRVRVTDSPLSVVFRYFLQIDPAWLHDRLAEGAPANRRTLEEEYRPLAAGRREQEDRRREREIPEKLLSPACISALIRFGATIDLHSDGRCRFFVEEEEWAVVRSDTMTVVSDADGAGSLVSFRPRSAAEGWLVAIIGARQRTIRGLPAFPPHVAHPGPRLETMASWPPGTQRWSATGEDGSVAQLSGERALACYRFALGRSLDEIVEGLSTC